MICDFDFTVAAAQSQNQIDCPPATTSQQPSAKRKAVQPTFTPAKAKQPKNNNSGKMKARKT